MTEMAIGMARADGSRRALVVAGWAGIMAGILGVVSGFALLFVDPAVTDDRYSYPLSADAFTAIQAWFAVQHVGLLLPQVAVLRAGLVGESKAARWGQWAGIAGMVGLIATEALAVSAAESPYPSRRTDVLDALYSVTTIAIGLGLTVAGAAALRGGVSRRIIAWVVLLVGAYVFVPMTPAIIAGFTPARLGIMGWMLLYGGLGLVLVRHAREPERAS